jgi:hypothetical protein
MRFLANENFPGAAVAMLKSAGHDVIWIRTAAPGASDLEALTRAAQDARVLLTFVKDFGELARASTLPATCGVVQFRIPMPYPNDVGRRLAGLITGRDDWVGHFSVAEPGRVRMRALA